MRFLLAIFLLFLAACSVAPSDPGNQADNAKPTIVQPTQAHPTVEPTKTRQPTLAVIQRAVDTQENNVKFSGDSGCPEGCVSSSSTCLIKGNINKEGEKIYHMPSQNYYDKTEIDSSYGERWFCTEDEAVANGWRKSKR